MYYVYLLRSELDGSPYIGQTNDRLNRLKRHNSGKVASTKSKKPWILVKYEEYPTRSDSMWREHILKTNANERKRFYDDI
jgi:putative endonuclease